MILHVNRCIILQQNLWLYSLIPTNTTGDLTKLVNFSQEETKKIHAVAKANGRTVTQLMTALTTIAYAEAAFKIASKSGEGRFNEVLSSYEMASHFLTVFNFINHVSYIVLNAFQHHIINALATQTSWGIQLF